MSGNQPQRRRAVTVEEFAHRKGANKALTNFRKRQDRKRTETAKALRKYKKTMKQEGFTPGQGASRKRPATSSDDHQPQNNKDEAPTTMTRKAKRAKTNPFSKSLQKKEQRQQHLQQSERDREAKEKEREAKLRQRRKRSKQLRQRTSRGQPVMKHVIHDILRKLERDQEKGQSAEDE